VAKAGGGRIASTPTRRLINIYYYEGIKHMKATALKLTFLTLAVTLSHVSMADTNGTATGGGASATGGYTSTATGSDATASAQFSTATGGDATASGEYSTSTGSFAQARGNYSTATGFNAQSTGDFSTATGQYSQATGENSTATGEQAKASGVNSTATGHFSNASGKSATATGTGASAKGNDSTAVGHEANAAGDNSTAIGNNSFASANDAVALGSGSVADRDNSVSVGSKGNERQVTNVADGVADMDAANVRQVNKAKDDAIHTSNIYTDEKIAQLNDSYNQRFEKLGDKINKVEKRLNAGIAGVTAITSIPYVTENSFSYGIGLGNYQNGNAIAAGVQYKAYPSTNVRLNVSRDSSGNSALGLGLAGGW